MRCCCPPESWVGLRSAKRRICTMSSASATRSRISDLRRAALLQPVGHVLGDRHVREERVRLEDGVDVAAVRAACRARERPEMRMSPASGLLEAGDHAQRRRLAAARRPEQRDELARLDRRARGGRPPWPRRSASPTRRARPSPSPSRVRLLQRGSSPRSLLSLLASSRFARAPSRVRPFKPTHGPSPQCRRGEPDKAIGRSVLRDRPSGRRPRSSLLPGRSTAGFPPRRRTGESSPPESSG